MKPFETIQSKAAYLPEENIDTDVIYPGRYLLLMDRDGLGPYAFRDRRFDADGAPIPDFVLNRPEFAEAKVLIAGDGFGCGSSREHAVWALAGIGIGCVIAPSFGEIFAANCLKNSVLALTLPAAQVAELGARAEAGALFEVDLEARRLSVDGVEAARIPLPEHQRQAMLQGWDETDILLREDGVAIEAFEAAHRKAQPWLFLESEL